MKLSAGKDAERFTLLVYSRSISMQRFVSQSLQMQILILGNHSTRGIGDLVPELGPRAVVLLVSGDVLPTAFNQYTVLRNIQYANAWNSSDCNVSL